MAIWKVITLVSGNIEAVSGPAAQGPPGTHEWVFWEGQAADKAETLQSADPRFVKSYHTVRSASPDTLTTKYPRGRPRDTLQRQDQYRKHAQSNV